jgi:signal transduction histidine kinase/DNA-binding response OmpR family regulator
MRWTIGKKVMAGFGLALTILIIIGLVSYWSMATLLKTANSVTHTHEVLTKLESVISLLKDVETGQRGYLITGDARYLEPYDAAISKVKRVYEEVKDLTKDNPGQQGRLDLVMPLIEKKLAELRETIALRKGVGFEAALEVVLTNRGKTIMDDIRVVIGAMQEEERRLLSERSVAAKANARNTQVAILLSTVGAFVLLLVISVAIARSITGRVSEISVVAVSLKKGDTDQTLPLASTQDEITDLAQAFNTMTAKRRQVEKELATTRDAALAAVRSKADFVATMSHEIRTPLNGVIGMTDLLLATDLDTDQQEMVETLKNSGEFLLTVINDILDFSKIDAGKLDLEVIDFDLRTAVDEVLNILAERASQKDLELIGLVYATTPLQLRGDPGRIRQILFNLIGNAIKFTQEGEIVVDVSVIETATDKTTLRFAVTDTGIGIAPETQRTLFESFTQADSSTTRKFGGTGLGLTICKKLVALMQGEIGVISEKGQGSTFWFSIPFTHSSTSSPPTYPNATLQGRRMCIVESNDTIRFLLQHYAQSWGMICDVAQNGSEGLALLQQHAKGEHSFDIALLDHTLSETIQEDGISLAKRIRQDSEISHIPLILLTALGKRGEGKLAQHAGFNGYLTKPIRHHQLQQCLQMILGSDQQTNSSTTSHSSTLITRHSVEEAQAQTQVHILLAEDNVVNQKVAVRMLQKIGYRVDVVINGQEAAEAVGRTSYDLVLMDCQMPEMDGLEATRAIRKAESRNLEVRSKKAETDHSETPDTLLLAAHCSRVPIIALTANALSGDRETCLEAGMDDFLTKPIRIEELGTMICKWLPNPEARNLVNQPITEKTRKHSSHLPACLDDTILENLKALGGEDNPEFFLNVIDQFLSDLPRHLEDIKQAVERQDSEALVKTAHACKGSSRSIGATLLAEMSFALELLGREGTMTDATAKFEQWLQEHERTIHAFQQEREQLTSSSLSTPLT